MYFFKRRKSTKKPPVRGLPAVKYWGKWYNECLQKHGTKYLPVAARRLAAVSRTPQRMNRSEMI